MTDLNTGDPFVNETTADANAVNSKFTAIMTFLNSIGAHIFQAGSVNTAALADDAVTATKVADGAIDAAAKIGDGVVTAAKVAADVATQAELDMVSSAVTAHTADASAAHAASAISVNSTTLAGTGTDVQASLEELDDAIAAVVAGGVAAGTIDTAQLADGAITPIKVEPGSQSFSASGSITYAGGELVVATGQVANITLTLPKIVAAGQKFIVFNNSTTYTVSMAKDGADTLTASSVPTIIPVPVKTAVLFVATSTTSWWAVGVNVHATRPEIVKYVLDLTPSVTHNTLTTINTTQSAEISGPGARVAWDATNKRPYAVIAGRFRAKCQVSTQLVSSGTAGIATAQAFLYHNGTTAVGSSQSSCYLPGAAGTYVQNTVEVVLDMAANDYVEMRGRHQSPSSSAGQWGTSVMSGYPTWIELEYLGPSS